MLVDEKTVTVMAYTLETVFAERFETIIRRNISTTRTRDYCDLRTLFRGRRSETRLDILKAAVFHTAKKRDSVQDIEDWCDIVKDIREEPQLYLLLDNYISENKYIGELEFYVVLDTVEELTKLLNL